MRLSGRRMSIAGIVGCLLCVPAFAGDWPTWRHDAQRRAAATDALPETLTPQWSIELPAPVPAWPNEPRLQFDLAHEPVVSGQTLVVGSSADGSVRALNTATGRERWRFYTEGPVRFAPAVWEGKAFIGSDDGYLYCLELESGKLLWKSRGAPEDRPQRRQLGNNRLISIWPVRGGPVVAEGTVYFAAGVWPTMGVFVVALDARSGRVVWRNDELGCVDKVRGDHNNLLQSGLSPQGYLVVHGDVLLVPNGRSMPAALDRRSGKLVYYVQGYRNGDCHVVAAEQLALVGQSGVIDVRTGREVGSRWAAAGKDAPKSFSVSKMDLFESPIFAYKQLLGCSWRSAVAGNIVFGAEQGTFYAYDLGQTKVAEYEAKWETTALKPWRWSAQEVWRLSVEDAKTKPPCSAVTRAGNRLYAQVGTNLVGVDMPGPGTQAKIAWSTPVKATVVSLVAADGRLFASAADGTLTCFGAQKVYATMPTTTPAVHEAKDGQRWTGVVRDIIERSKVTEGYCVILGAGGGALVQEMLHQSPLKIIAVYNDAAKVNALRASLVDEGVYGSRVEVFTGDPLQFDLPPYLASLIIAGDAIATAPVTEDSVGRMFQSLRPYGGTACILVSERGQDAWEKQVTAARLENAQSRRANEFLLLSRVGALPGSAPWTHESSDAARSFFSKDQRVQAPLGILWYGDGPDYGFWKIKDYGGGVKPQVVGGRLFALQQHTNTLVAYDVYTGRVLWKKQADPRARQVSTARAIYIAGGQRVQALDPVTGKELAVWPFKTEVSSTPKAADLRVTEDLIVVAVEAHLTGRASGQGTLVALERTSGKTLWTHTARGLSQSSLAVAGKRVFLTDTTPLPAADPAQNDPPKALPYTIIALDAATGQPRWSVAREYPTRRPGNWVAFSEACGLLLAGDFGRTVAMDPVDGRVIWDIATGELRQPLILRGQTMISQSGTQMEIRTGKTVGQAKLPLTHFGCNYAVACEHLVLVRDSSACYVDLQSGKKQNVYAARSGCSNSLIAADGVLNVPCFSVQCVCNYPMQTSFAMVSMPEAADWIDTTPTPQLYQSEPANTSNPPR